MHIQAHHFYALLLALNVAGFPLVAGIATFTGVPSTYLSIAMRALIVALSFGLLILAVSRRNVHLLKGPHWLPLGVFWTAYLLRVLYSTVTEPESLSSPPTDYWIWSVGGCLIPLLGQLTAPPIKTWPAAYAACLGIALAASSLTVLQGDTTVTSQVSGQTYDSGRLALESLNPISAGHLGASLVLLSIWPLISRNTQPSIGQYPLIFACSALGLYLAIASASRGPVISLLLTTLFYVLALEAKRIWKPLLLFCVIGTAGYMVATRFDESGQFSLLLRIANAVGGEDAAVSSRTVSIAGAIQQFVQSPILGDGLEERITGYYPHNLILESFMATGIAGGLPFVALIIVGVRSAFRLIRSNSANAWISMIFLQYLLGSQFSGSLYASTTFWTTLGAIISLDLCEARIRRTQPIPIRHSPMLLRNIS